MDNGTGLNAVEERPSIPLCDASDPHRMDPWRTTAVSRSGGSSPEALRPVGIPHSLESAYDFV
ncbi:MAG TPA: hypothetical protein PK781_01860 [Terrimesophilobacter sp.]|nr:hypothetical protein [Terrimesophilobacter sp.]